MGVASWECRTLLRKHVRRREVADSAERSAASDPERELEEQELRELGIPASELITAGTIANPTFEFELLPERDSQYELRVEYELTSLLMAPLRLEDDPSDRQADTWRWGAGVTLEVPLFDRGQGRLHGIESRFDAASERYQGLAIDVRSAARDARSRLTSSDARVREYRTVIVPAERSVLEQTLLQYNAMQLGVFQLLSAQRELLDVELAYVDTLRDYWSARAEVEALTRGRVVRGAEARPATTLQAAGPAEGGH